MTDSLQILITGNEIEETVDKKLAQNIQTKLLEVINDGKQKIAESQQKNLESGDGKVLENIPKFRESKKKPNRKLKTCEICGKVFDKLTALKDHFNIHTGVRPFECLICGKKFASRSVLYLHKKCHDPQRSFKCKVCEKSFVYLSGLQNHERIHTGEKPHQCVECGKCFTQQAGLIQHSRVHKTIKPFHCDECDFKAALVSDVKTHKKRVHENPRLNRVFTCEICNKVYKYKSTLRKHMNVHSSSPVAKTLLCEMCGKTFSAPRLLVAHKRIHTGERPFVCNVCGKTFCQTGTLLRHKFVHSGVKPYICELCDLQFLAPSLLMKHKCKKLKEQIQKGTKAISNVIGLQS